MSSAIHCDGCGAELGQLPLPQGVRERRIHGGRADGSCGLSPLPNGEFDWCETCAKVAFQAVKNANAPGRAAS